MSQEPQKGFIPGWLWALLALMAVGLVVGLMLTDRRQEPGESYRFDLSQEAKVNAAEVTFEETARIAINLEKPSALALGPDGSIYVAGENTVVVLDSKGAELSRHAAAGLPGCLAVTPGGKLLLGMRDHIEVLDPQGGPTAVWPSLGEQTYLTSVVADAEHIYAADAGNRVVWHLDHSGNVQRRIGERNPGTDAPGFVVPSPCFDLAFDPMGSLWAVNPGKHGLENYTPEGKLISAWYRPGMDLGGFCGCCNPIHIAFRSNSSVVTAEKGLNRIKVYGPDHELLGVVATPEMLANVDKAVAVDDSEPMIRDLVVDQQDRILALHQPAKVILVFEDKKPVVERK
jgi:hypothetical protein